MSRWREVGNTAPSIDPRRAARAALATLPWNIMPTVDFTPDRPRTLITAGPTQEPIDDVRYLSNRSSGQMGLALAADAAARGWPVTLLLGPIAATASDLLVTTALAETARDAIRVERFRTATDLLVALVRLWPQHDLLIMAAAVADFRPAHRVAGKLRREAGLNTHLVLEPVPDLLQEIAPLTRVDQVAVGFALEPAETLIASASAKLRRKRLDAIVANPLETMDASDIEAALILADGLTERPVPPRLPKDAFAQWLLDRCAALRARRAPDAAPP